MKPRSMFDYYKYYIYSFKNFKKTLGFPNSSEKIFSGKTSLLFRHFSPTTTFPDKTFYQTNRYLQTEVKVELHNKFFEWQKSIKSMIVWIS